MSNKEGFNIAKSIFATLRLPFLKGVYCMHYTLADGRSFYFIRSVSKNSRIVFHESLTGAYTLWRVCEDAPRVVSRWGF